MRKILFAVAAFFFLLTVAVYFLLFTRSGMQIMVSAAEKLCGGRLQVESIQGKIGQSFALEHLSFTSKTNNFSVDSFEISWSPIELLYGKVHIKTLVLHDLHFSQKEVEVKKKKEKGKIVLPEFSLPLPVEIDALEATNIVFDSGDSTTTVIDAIDLGIVAGQKRIQINDFQLQGRSFAVDMSGTVGLVTGWPVDLTGNWRYTGVGLPEMQGRYTVSDSLENGILEITAAPPLPLDITGKFRIGDGVMFDVEIAARDFDPAVIAKDYPGLLDVNITTHGQLKDGKLTAEVISGRISGELTSLPVLVNAKAEFDGDRLNISEGIFQSRSAQLHISGSIGTQYDLAYSLDISKLGDFASQVKGAVSLQGEVGGPLKNPKVRAALHGENAHIEGVTISSIEAEIEGDPFAGGGVRGTGKLQDVRQNEYLIEQISLFAEGSVEQHRLEVDLHQGEKSLSLVAEGAYRDKSWKAKLKKMNFSEPQKRNFNLKNEADIVVSSTHAILENFCLTNATAMLCVAGKLQNEIWQVKADLDHFDPSQFWGDKKGDISAKLTGNGKLSSSESLMEFQLVDLRGSLDGRPLSGGGKAELKGGDLTVNGLELHYGDALITAEGTLSEQKYDINVFGNVPNFEHLLSAAEGQLFFSGNISGEAQHPVVELDVQVRDFRMNEFSIEAIDGDIGVDLEKDGIVNVNMHGRNISNSQIMVQDADVNIGGTTSEHSFTINGATDVGTASITGKGGYDTSWAGVIENGLFSSIKYGEYTQVETAELKVEGQSGTLNNFCFKGPGANLCMDGSFASGGLWAIELLVKRLSLSLLDDAGMTSIPVRGEMEGEISAEGDQKSLSSLNGWLRIPEIDISEKSGDERRSYMSYAFSDNLVNFSKNGASLDITASSIFEQKGNVSAKITLQNISEIVEDGGAIPIQGDVDFKLDDLSFLSILTSSFLQPSEGDMQGHFNISGTLAEPVYQGNIALKHGKVYLAEYGITLRDIAVEMHNEEGLSKYIITAASGPGNARGEGTIQLAPGSPWRLTSHLSGSDFEIYATDEYVIRTTPELELVWGEEGSSLTGTLAIPFARVTLKSMENKISASDDVVIVDDLDSGGQQKSHWVMDLGIILGDDVKIDAYGLKSDLAGEIELEDAPGKLVQAFGELDVKNGKFSFYSVELDVTRGRLLFAGGSIENPGVDFRAQRRVESRVVGVEVGGAAEDLEFQLFSDPAMDESDILAYMLVGRSMYASNDNDQSLISAAAQALGVRGINSITTRLEKYLPIDEIYLDGGTGTEDMSIVFGKNLTDDLFIGYDQNLFDSTGEFKARYKLGGNFSIETRTSVNSTSGDILYSIER